MTKTTRYIVTMQTSTGLWYWAGINDADPLAGYSQWKPEPDMAMRYQRQSAAISKAAQLQKAAERLFGPVDVRVETVSA